MRLSLSLSLSLIVVAANAQTLTVETDKGSTEKQHSTRSAITAEKAASQGNAKESKVSTEKQRTASQSRLLAEHLADAAEHPEVANSDIHFSVIDGLPVATTINRSTGSMSIIVENKVFHASHHGMHRYTLSEDRTTRDFLASLKIDGSPFTQADKSKSIEDGEEELPPIIISGSNDADSGGGPQSPSPYYYNPDPYYQDPMGDPPAPAPETPLQRCRSASDKGMKVCQAVKHPYHRIACIAAVGVVYARCVNAI